MSFELHELSYLLYISRTITQGSSENLQSVEKAQKICDTFFQEVSISGIYSNVTLPFEEAQIIRGIIEEEARKTRQILQANVEQNKISIDCNEEIAKMLKNIKIKIDKFFLNVEIDELQSEVAKIGDIQFPIHGQTISFSTYLNQVPLGDTDKLIELRNHLETANKNVPDKKQLLSYKINPFISAINCILGIYKLLL